MENNSKENDSNMYPYHHARPIKETLENISVPLLNKFIADYVTLKLTKEEYDKFKKDYYEQLDNKFLITVQKKGLLFPRYYVYFGIDPMMFVKFDIDKLKMNLGTEINVNE